ncbi:MAG: hypothetical protein ACOZQL_03565 [Myxococcota bacterium]
MNRLLLFPSLVVLAACNPESTSKLDIAPEYNTPGVYRCSNCPDWPGAKQELNAGAVTSTRFEGTVQNAVGNGQFYIRGRNGEEVVGTLVTQSDGSFSTNAPLFCGEQLVKCVWNNAAGKYVLVQKVITTDCVDADVRVTLSWDDKADDLELHLIKPGGRINQPTDCTWTTCISSQPDWGVQGDASDNPKKDVDDTGDFGPENVFLAKPESGVFHVMVEHWGSGAPMNKAQLIINVKGRGATVLERSDIVPQHVWRAATITWPEGTVTTEGTDFDCTASWSGGCTAQLP